jgi:hypothetical protein
MLMMMRRPEFLMMRRPEFLIMRRPCAALRRAENKGRTASILLLTHFNLANKGAIQCSSKPKLMLLWHLNPLLPQDSEMNIFIIN